MKLKSISKNSPTIFAFGEVLWDILFEKSRCTGGHIGGSMFNSAVTMARSGLLVEMITLLGDDKAGVLISDFLVKNKIMTNFTSILKDSQTNLALAFLNNSGDAHYQFYKDKICSDILKQPSFKYGDFLLFGSGWSREDALSKYLESLKQNALANQALIIFDPNMRRVLNSFESKQIKDLDNHLSNAHIVRGSHEDFANLWGTNSALESYQKLQSISKAILIYTRSDLFVEIYTPTLNFMVEIEKVKVINTIGAGDNFNAGLIFALAQKGVKLDQLHELVEADWRLIIRCAIKFGSAACMIKENYLSKRVLKKMALLENK